MFNSSRDFSGHRDKAFVLENSSIHQSILNNLQIIESPYSILVSPYKPVKNNAAAYSSAME